MCSKLYFMLASFTLLSCASSTKELKENTLKVEAYQNPAVVKNKARQAKKEQAISTTLYSAEELKQRIENEEEPVFFYAMGNEPFWNLSVCKHQVLYESLGDDKLVAYKMTNHFHKNLPVQVIQFEDAKGLRHDMEIKQGPANDGMSEKVYNYSVRWFTMSLNGVGELKS